MVNLKTIMENSLNMFRENAAAHDIHISLNINGIPEIISADEKMLKQVFYNLLSNAVKFTPDGGEVKLSARHLSLENTHLIRENIAQAQGFDPDGNGPGKHENFIEFSVSDNGVGVKPEDRERIFGRFEQADGTVGKKFQGSGLGLPLARSLVELHNGRLWVESEGEGKGATFRFLIPAVRPSTRT
jgi:signal transduction histidine kinase